MRERGNRLTMRQGGGGYRGKADCVREREEKDKLILKCVFSVAGHCSQTREETDTLG